MGTSRVELWDPMLKMARNALSKKDYDLLKNIGVTIPEKRPDIAANVAYGKLQELLTMTRLVPRGHVVNLGAGKGGWNQYLASLPSVASITAYTFGKNKATPGHENYAPINYLHKEKVREVYSDIRGLKPGFADAIFFDAGEIRSTVEREVKDSVRFWEETLIPWLRANPSAAFCIKVIDAATPRITEYLTLAQKITGKGNLYRSHFSKASSNELYFMSTKTTNLKSRIRVLYLYMLNQVISLEKSKKVTMTAPPKFEIKEKVYPLLKPLDLTASYKQLGDPISVSGNSYRHWISRGIYNYGSTGTTSSVYNRWISMILGPMIAVIPGLTYWKATDTTPQGFKSVFKAKIDTAPREDTEYDMGISRIYDALGEYFKAKGFTYHELTKEELYAQMNKAGAASAFENYSDVRDFLSDPTWYEQVQQVRANLLKGTPTFGIFTGIGKREKKKTIIGTKGSRMVAYLPVVMRALELQLFSCFLELTHKEMLKFGVGGLGLHDLGQRLAEIWKGAGISDDIAGFDTRVGLRRLSDEARFLHGLSNGNKIIWYMYRLYAFPNVLIPTDAPKGFTRSELVSGIGQRMSGTGPTYMGNTIMRAVLALATMCISKGIKQEDWGKEAIRLLNDDSVQGVISGDDCTLVSYFETVLEWANSAKFLGDMGFPRKDVAMDSVPEILTNIEDVDFCSHHYVKVSYYDSETDTVIDRYRPTRTVAEILGKSLIWLGTTNEMMDEMAWASAQGLNLLCNYHHLSTCKTVGMAIRSLVNPNIILAEKGRHSIMPRPWITNGDVLDIINEVNFGRSTAYPVPGFRVRHLKHLGVYKYQEIYDKGFYETVRAGWRKGMFFKLKGLINTWKTGGDISLYESQVTMYS